MAEKTLEERLSELYEKIDHRDQFFDKDLKTLIDGIRDAREHGGTASVDVTPIVGGYKIVITDSEGVEHVATVKDGGDAYEVYKSTVPEGQSPMTKEEWLETLKGVDGATPTINQTTKHWEIGGSDTGVLAEGHNPNRGTYNVGDTFPNVGIAGDYIAVIDDTKTTPTAEIHKWNATQNDWVPTGVSPNDAQFEDGQLLPNTKIDDTKLGNPAGNSLARATDVSSIKHSIGEFGISEVVATVSPVSGKYVNGNTGGLTSLSGSSYAYINVDGYDKVRFKGVAFNLGFSSSSAAGFAFGTMTGGTFSPSRYLSFEKYSGESPVTKEYILDIPTGCTYLAVTTEYPNMLSDFYCYLQRGVNIPDSIRYKREYVFYGSNSSAISKAVLWNIDLLAGHTYKFYANGMAVTGTTSFAIKKADSIVGVIPSITTTRNNAELILMLDTDSLGCRVIANIPANDTITIGVEEITNEKVVEKTSLIKGLDNEPIAGSGNLVKSGGVFNSLPLSFKRTGTVTTTAVGNFFSLKHINLQKGKRYVITVSIDTSTCTVKLVDSNDVAAIIQTLSSYLTPGASPKTFDYIPNEDIKDAALAHYVGAAGSTVEVSIEELSEDKLREDMASISDRVTALENGEEEDVGNGEYLGVFVSEFTVATGDHSSTNDRMDVSFKPNTYNLIRFKNVDATLQGTIGIYGFPVTSAETPVSGSATFLGSKSATAGEFSIEYLADSYPIKSIGVYCTAIGVGKVQLIVDTAYSDVKYTEESVYNQSIEGMNAEAFRRLDAVNTKFRHYGDSASTKYLCMLMVTDTHNDLNRLGRAFELAANNRFNILLHGGDIVEGPGQIAGVGWKDRVLAINKPVLAIAGNHEFNYTGSGVYNVNLKDADISSWLYDSDLMSHNGETHPTIGGVFKNYYHRDITVSGNTYRIIALYQYEWDVPSENDVPLYQDGHGKDVVFYSQEQIGWLVGMLKNTPASTPVIIFSHSPLSPIKYIDCPFNDPVKNNGQVDSSSMSSFMNGDKFFTKLINAWVNGGTCNISAIQTTSDGVQHSISVNETFNGGGKFIGNICGHLHSGGVGYMVNEDNTPSTFRVVIQPTSNANYAQNTGWWGRETSGFTQDCLNAIVYSKYSLDKNNTSMKDRLTIVRFGTNINLFGEDCKAFTF